jgi:hypothetical protein
MEYISFVIVFTPPINLSELIVVILYVIYFCTWCLLIYSEHLPCICVRTGCAVVLTFLWPLWILAAVVQCRLEQIFLRFVLVALVKLRHDFTGALFHKKVQHFYSMSQCTCFLIINNPLRYFQKSGRSNMKLFPPIVKHSAMRCLRTVNAVSRLDLIYAYLQLTSRCHPYPLHHT